MFKVVCGIGAFMAEFTSKGEASLGGHIPCLMHDYEWFYVERISDSKIILRYHKDGSLPQRASRRKRKTTPLQLM